MRPGTHLDGRARRVILCADDYGISAGVSRGILELARAGRLSATSAIVTLARWPRDAPALAATRDRIATGLHINLTLGAPLGAMPSLAPDGRLPDIGTLTRAALLGRIDAGEIEGEVLRQIDSFVAAVGHAPDHVDGHQHAHALPGVREGVLGAVGRRLGHSPPLLRDPADSAARILRRGGEVGKALAIAGLAAGFGRAARRHGLPTSDGFSGVSAFDARRDFAVELAQAMRLAGRRHIVMCHPGHADAELAALDPVTERRGQELSAIMAMSDLAKRLWRPTRAADGAPIDWSCVDWSAPSPERADPRERTTTGAGNVDR